MSEVPLDPTSDSNVPPHSSTAKPSDVSTADTRPTLSAYFGEDRIAAGTFVKAVRSSKIKRFDDEDRLAALNLIRSNDSEGERLWALMSVPQLPDSITGWIGVAAKTYLERLLGPNVDLGSQAPDDLTASFRKRFSGLSSTKDKAEQRTFNNSLRILANWLQLRSHLDAWEVIDQCGALIGRNETAALAALRTGSAKEFRLAASVGSLARRRLSERENELARANEHVSGLRRQLEVRTGESLDLARQLEELRSQFTDKAIQLYELQAQISSQRQHAGYDLATVKATNAILLRERIRPLVQDAIDALEIQTPAPDLAVRRLRTTLSTIEESLK